MARLLTFEDYPTIPQRFSDSVARHASRPAVCDGNGTLNYQQLSVKAHAVAERLVERFPDKPVCIGIYGLHSNELIVSLLGILLAGHHYLYVDLKQASELNASLCAQVNCNLIINCSDIPLERCSLPLIAFSALLRPGVWQPLPSFDAAQAAYINFSSGTTGQPKAILCTHAGVSRLCERQSYMDFSEDRRFLVNSPLSFDAATLEIWGALLNGGCCVLNDLGPLQPRTLEHLIGDRGVDTAWFTSSLFNTLVDVDIECLVGLRYLLTGGDVLSIPHVRRVLQRYPTLHLVNGYGPTENTTFTCCYVVQLEDLDANDIPIGYPITGTAVMLVDQQGRVVTHCGEPGEIVAFGAGLAQGYLADPARTAISFVEMPYKGGRERAYRTGDSASYDAKGRLRFIGRGDGQIKINGYRLSLPGLEQHFRRQQGVHDCALVVREHRGVKQLLCAWTGEDSVSLESSLALLPTWQRPHACYQVHALPLTAHGKLDRNALLQQLEAGVPAVDSSLDADEQLCAQLWNDLLGCEITSASQDFYQCGGNSLLAMQLVALCRYPGHPGEIALSDIQTHSTLGDFVDVLNSRGLEVQQLLNHAMTPEHALVLPRRVG